MKRQVMRADITAAVVGLGLAATMLVGTAVPAVGGPSGASAAGATVRELDRDLDPPAMPPIGWTPCGLGSSDCATVRVPLDHDRPDGPTIDLALRRVPATSPATRIGTLFVNPGGPGDSGVDYVPGFAFAIPAAVRERFDIVGFDPRGIAGSTPVRCFGGAPDVPWGDPLAPYPETGAEEDRFIAEDRRVVHACRENAGPILRHMSTADVARDLDLLRQAVGDEQLTYVGYSYGSFLGQTYANLFPDRVRALVIDGVIDPRAWVGEGIERWTVPVETRLRGAESAQQTLEEFFRLCDEAGQGCPFAPGASYRFERLAQRLRSGPIELFDGSGTRTVTLNNLILQVFGALHSPAFWPFLAGTLAEVEAAASLPPVPSGAASPHAQHEPDQPGRLADDLVNDFDVRAAVLCADSENPRSYRRYREAADAAEAGSYFGRLWNWRTSECAIWPAEARLDRYAGPWDAWTANPVLIVGNRFDPATGYHGAVAASQLLPNSSLVTYAGWGHGGFLAADDDCVDEAVATYLLTSATPAGDLTCEPVGSPFDPVEAGPAQTPVPVLPAILPPEARQALDRSGPAARPAPSR
ncbi:alpha/beta hydrolase [Cellulomonas aerilata]|uniref:Peptidase n=1 Tax=Cellulomonas aerilata TaxID=515326 RepID=A0A512DAD7_9CELL|nr:alpha/beta hydrolase [Cellulomonas aerilata]GEO33429.1 peptidase [Cellulomonas aerilata]